MHFWSIKGVYFLQNANNLNSKLFFFILYTWPTKQVFCLYLRRILDNKSFWMSLKSPFLASKKSCKNCPNWGEGRGGNLEKIQKNSSLFRGVVPKLIVWWPVLYSYQMILFFWNLLLILVGSSLACSDRETESSSGVILAPSLPPSLAHPPQKWSRLFRFLGILSGNTDWAPQFPRHLGRERGRFESNWSWHQFWNTCSLTFDGKEGNMSQLRVSLCSVTPIHLEKSKFEDIDCKNCEYFPLRSRVQAINT